MNLTTIKLNEVYNSHTVDEFLRRLADRHPHLPSSQAYFKQLEANRQKYLTMQIPYKLNNGTTITGTLEQILAVVKAVGETLDTSKLPNTIELPNGMYLSNSKGLLKISEMAPAHAWFAFSKMFKVLLKQLDEDTAITAATKGQRLSAFSSNKTAQLLLRRTQDKV